MLSKGALPACLPEEGACLLGWLSCPVLQQPAGQGLAVWLRDM